MHGALLLYRQHPVSTLHEGAPSFFLTWPDSFSQEIYTGTDQNICHSKPLWPREMRHCELGPHTSQGTEMLSRVGDNGGCCSTPQTGGSLGCTSTRNVLWGSPGPVQVCGAPRSVSLQAGEPPLVIKAQNLSLPGFNSSLSKADV